MNVERRRLAWDLVRAYMREHMSEVPKQKHKRFRDIEEEKIAPLGALVAFELARRRLSYMAGAIQIGRALPDSLSKDRPPLAPSTLHYLQKPERASWRATPQTLEQLAYGFEWDLDWLRQVNCEPIGGQVADYPAPVSRVIELMLEMPAEQQEAIMHFASSLHGQAQPIESSRMQFSGAPAR